MTGGGKGVFWQTRSKIYYKKKKKNRCHVVRFSGDLYIESDDGNDKREY